MRIFERYNTAIWPNIVQFFASELSNKNRFFTPYINQYDFNPVNENVAQDFPNNFSHGVECTKGQHESKTTPNHPLKKP